MIVQKKKDKVKYGTTTIPYYVIKSRRVKTSEIIVDANNITIRTPINKGKLEIQRIVLDKVGWILKKQREYTEASPQIIKPTFVKKSILPYLGRNYPLRIFKKQTSTDIEFVDGEFMVTLKSLNAAKGLIKRVFESWLIKKAKSIFKDKVGEYSQLLGVKPKKIICKNLKNRWGSITKVGAINLNINLLKASEDVIDYIILHELCHLKIKEHSHHYWDLVRKHMPDYQQKIDWLAVNGTALV